MSLLNVVVVAIVAATAPALSRSVLKGFAPGVVVEILAGLVLGPHVLGWISVDGPNDTLAALGLAFLFFLAGLEIDLGVIRGALLVRSMAAYVAGLALALAIAALLHGWGLVTAPALVAV